MFIYNNFILQGRFFPSFQFLCSIQRNPSHIISKQLGRKNVLMEELPIDSYKLLCKQKNSISIINKFLVFVLIAIKQKILASIALYIFRLFTFYHSLLSFFIFYCSFLVSLMFKRRLHSWIYHAA